ncbi:hypothetical protein K502DRAFT_350182 [Neoconidiobolus thromboides FSU 785]|nr:hypothetical protein K502DRAFT_350182 [Neoconidiobolus thromboides FSU 785]
MSKLSGYTNGNLAEEAYFRNLIENLKRKYAACCNAKTLKSWSCSHCKEILVQHAATYFDKSTESKACLLIDKEKKVDRIILDRQAYIMYHEFNQYTDTDTDTDRLLSLYIGGLKALLSGVIAILSTLVLRQNLDSKDNGFAAFTYCEPISFGSTKAVNNSDTVPHLPPQINFLSNYCHHHNEI